MKNVKKYSPEVKQRARRLYLDHRSEHSSDWAAMGSIASKIGCSTASLSDWVKQHQRNTGKREGPTTTEHERVKALEREVRELRRANEILKLASAFFAQAQIERQIKS